MSEPKKTCGTCGYWSRDPMNPEKRIGLCTEMYAGGSAMLSNESCEMWEVRE